MTREEIADKFEELAKGIREGKELQQDYNISTATNWKKIDLSGIEFFVENVRIKPETKYVPFTADDWREFDERMIGKGGIVHDVGKVLFWNLFGCMMSTSCNDSHTKFVTYKILCNEYIFYDTCKPVGKEVKE